MSVSPRLVESTAALDVLEGFDFLEGHISATWFSRRDAMSIPTLGTIPNIGIISNASSGIFMITETRLVECLNVSSKRHIYLSHGP